MYTAALLLLLAATLTGLAVLITRRSTRNSGLARRLTSLGVASALAMGLIVLATGSALTAQAASIAPPTVPTGTSRVVLITSPNPSYTYFGFNATATVSVGGSTAPTGTVSFSFTKGTSTVHYTGVAIHGNTATVPEFQIGGPHTVGEFAPGSWMVQATYSGNTHYSGSASNQVTQQIRPLFG